MIHMEVRAHDEVDVVHRQAGRGKAAHERVVLLLVPQRTRFAVLVVADATIDQDVVAPGLHDVGLEAQHQVVLRIQRGGREPGAVLRQHLGLQLRQELQGGGEAAFHLDDPVDRHVADAECVGHFLAPLDGSSG